MAEFIRPHDRITKDSIEAYQEYDLDGTPFSVFLMNKWSSSDTFDLIFHFHGMETPVLFASQNTISPSIVLLANLGTGSSVYQRTLDSIQLIDLIGQIENKLLPKSKYIRSVTLTAFSAGYGAVRSIFIKQSEMVDNVILLDGLHCSYIPARTPIFEGGRLDSTGLIPFIDFAKKAINKEVRFIITHSTIFPGTFASTTETSQYILDELSIKRNPFLRQGPLGMQQIGLAKSGNFEVISFAGNTAPDHVDQFHGLGYFLKDILL
jgi:hypothetical protein